MKIHVVVLLSIISVVAAQDAQIYCGRRLARTLADLCYKDYQKNMKRSEYEDINTPEGMKRSSYAYYGNAVAHRSPWLPAAARGLQGGRGKRTGVADECCDKPCMIEELMSYC